MTGDMTGDPEDAEATARTFTIYHPDGTTTRMTSEKDVDFDVREGRLLILYDGRVRTILPESDWVSVNHRPRAR
ncbi:hypothetical protein T8T21_05465 [Limimaricola variabilis]|uniref:hypothetical protein n=1 Tax=Limimaricola variabilis TaxID=1492771 RepID=UPI002AC98FB5|nr:hypothetical protein [Limimaricola variabilis]WPY95572.1 hypothetical protein T8T21_05465 [Limimaricola variabilis]